jgi:hypothetical protein
MFVGFFDAATLMLIPKQPVILLANLAQTYIILEELEGGFIFSKASGVEI